MYFKRAKRSIKTIIYIYPFKKSNISKVCNFYKHMCEHFKFFLFYIRSVTGYGLSSPDANRSGSATPGKNIA